MVALQVCHNGQEVCTAGIGVEGVIGAHVNWVRRTGLRTQERLPESEEVELHLHVGGLHSPTGEVRTWHTPELTVGDRVEITVVETEHIHAASEVKNFPHEDALARERNYVRRKAAEFGWTLQEANTD